MYEFLAHFTCIFHQETICWSRVGEGLLDVSRCDFLKVTSTSSVGVARCIVMPQLPLGDIQINVPDQIAHIKGAPEFTVIRGLLCAKDYNLLMIITASAVLALLHNFQMGLLASKLPRGYGSIV
jgi:hypothetical protein